MREMRKNMPASSVKRPGEAEKPQSPQMRSTSGHEAGLRARSEAATAEREVRGAARARDCATKRAAHRRGRLALKEALKQHGKAVGENSVELDGIWNGLYRALAKDPAQALPYIEKRIAAIRRRRAPYGVRAGMTLGGYYRELALALYKVGRKDEAKAAARTAIDKAAGSEIPGTSMMAPGRAAQERDHRGRSGRLQGSIRAGQRAVAPDAR